MHRRLRVKFILPALTEATSPFWRPIKYSLFPPLGLATLAAYLRADDDAVIVDEHVEPVDAHDRPDLVVIQVYITNARRAYALAEQLLGGWESFDRQALGVDRNLENRRLLWQHALAAVRYIRGEPSGKRGSGCAMKRVEQSLQERAGRMYRRLLLLQRLFHRTQEDDEGEAQGADDRARDLAFGAAVREVLDELTEHARLLTCIPFPLSEWRPGDTRDDERWRALTEVERREVLSLVSGYDNLVTWAEEMTRGQWELAELVEVGGGVPSEASPASTRAHQAMEYLKAERARIGRFRQDMAFLSRRSVAE
jgi:hypothetical protein